MNTLDALFPAVCHPIAADGELFTWNQLLAREKESRLPSLLLVRIVT